MKYVILIALLALAGCATTSARRLALLNEGMSKQEVIAVLGTPADTGMNGRQEWFNYWMYDGTHSTSWYTVNFKDGRVVTYARNNAGGAGTALLLVP